MRLGGFTQHSQGQNPQAQGQNPQDQHPSAQKRLIVLVIIVLAVIVWASVQWLLVRPAAIERDYFDWRQADTQSIALNFLHQDDRLLWPRINWRGAGPGFVESECQLFPYLAMQLMRLGGEGIWAGQLISLLAMALAMAITLWQLAKRFSAAAVLAAAVVLFSARNSLFLSTSVQPDALAFLAYICGFWSFLAWLQDPRAALRPLIAAAIFTALAALIKPPALHLGIVQFMLVVLIQPSRLRRAPVWLAWICVLVVVGSYLAHAAQLHLQYGNTFGVISGGDSKFPKLQHLLDLTIWRALAERVLSWGLGILGVVAVMFVLLRGRGDKILLALSVGIVIHLVVALRYTSGGYGSHYHVYLLLLGAYAMAKAWDIGAVDLQYGCTRINLPRLIVPAGLILGLALSGYGVQRIWVENQERLQDRPFKPETMALAGAFQQYLLTNKLTVPLNAAHKSTASISTTAMPLPWPLTQQLVAVRSVEFNYDAFWQSVQNFEDPRFFYTARVFGWILPANPLTPVALETIKQQGTAYYAEPFGIADEPELDAWLASNAQLIVDIPAGKVWRL